MQETPHHGDRWFKDAFQQGENREKIAEVARELTAVAGLGETGSHPLGAMTPDDEGELRLAVTSTGGKVVLAFGKPVAWIGLSPRDARALADKLNEWAARV